MTERISVDSAGSQGNNFSFAPVISADGRFVAFTSAASNLVAEDTNGAFDVFVRDRLAGTTERVSTDSNGGQANNQSGVTAPLTGSVVAISADGRFVAFASRASNLVADDTNGESDVFVHDRASGQTERVSVGAGGQGNSVSGWSAVTISADGLLVAFDSFASNLVGADTNGGVDAFVHNRQTGQTERVSVSSDETEANSSFAGLSPAISADGRFIAFASVASNLVPGDTNGFLDVFVRDRQTGVTDRASIADGGVQADFDSPVFFAVFGLPLAISADGRFVAFTSAASNLVADDTNSRVDLFVRDREAGTTDRVTVDSAGAQANGQSYTSAISADGRFVTFASDASNLVAGDVANGDAFVHDRETRTTELVSVDSAGVPGQTGHSFAPAISGDGRFVAFESTASNLVGGDTNGVSDIFVRDRGAFADTEPPVLTVPSPITVDAESAAGAAVLFGASATDNLDPDVPVTCRPASGSIFPVGTTTVICTATDNAGNTASAAFDVFVKGGAAQIGDLIALIKTFPLDPEGFTRSLTAKLGDALAALQSGDSAIACELLGDLRNEVQAQSGKKLSTEQADRLTAVAGRIQAVLGCA